jgi:rod shape determining protein RodA
VFENVFKQHHRDRFNILLGKTVDLKGIGYNNQSEIAIGSGGMGKVLRGTQTKGGFVPEQHTFHTVGEEVGLCRLDYRTWSLCNIVFENISLKDKKTKFSRVYGYVAEAYTLFCKYCYGIGIFPTIGVPLSFHRILDHMGSTILLFIFLKNGCQ